MTRDDITAARGRHNGAVIRAARNLRDLTRNLVRGEDGDQETIEAWEALDRALTDRDDWLAELASE